MWQPDEVPADLKDKALHDAACNLEDAQNADAPTLSASAIRVGGRETGTIVQVQGSCHCQGSNCDTLVYLRTGDQYQLSLKEKYASLHPMKIVKQGMPSLTGEFKVDEARMETTVYDWNGKEYKPSLCATIVKGAKLPRITRHACKDLTQ
ncbi:MAG TPA: hypothetical protein VFB76_10185 [Candidatus Angelobacter sp.]|nr:hypothetical protein [Candidatus Angelobacter sp.]